MIAPGGQFRRRNVIRPIVTAVGFMIALWAWALSSPVGSAPDDTYHLPLVWCAWGENDGCAQQSDGTLMIPGTVANICTYQRPQVSAACEYLRSNDLTTSGQISYISSAGPGQALTGTDRVLSNTSAFHRVMRIFVGEDAEQSAIVMRIGNGVLAGALLLWLLLVAPLRVRRAVAVTWLLVSVPVGMFIMSSTNPSSWAVIGTAAYWGFTLAFVSPGSGSNPRRLWAGIGAVVSAIVALAGRVDSLVFLAAATIAAVVLRWPVVRQSRGFLVVGVLAGVAGVAVLALTSIGDRVVAAGRGLLNSDIGGADPSLTVNGVDPLVNHVVELPSYLLGFVGGQNPSFAFPSDYQRGLGWLDTSVPSLVGSFMAVALTAAVVWGLQSYNVRKVAAVALAFVALIGSIIIPLLAASSNDFNLQPRYSLPGLIVFVGLCLVAVGPIRPPRLLIVWLVLTLVVVAQSVALLASLRRYTNGESLPWMRLDLVPSWWWHDMPLSPLGVWIVGTMGFAVAGIGAGSIWRSANTRAERKPSDHRTPVGSDEVLREL